MANERKELAEQLDLIGEIFEIDGMVPLLLKFNEKNLTTVKFNAITMRIISLLLKRNKGAADKLVMMNKGLTAEEVDAMDDGQYSKALREAVTGDVLGFFV